MKINFNDVLAAMLPAPFELEVDGAEHAIKRLSIADVAALESLERPVDGETAEQHGERLLKTLRSYFEFRAPAFLDGPIPAEAEARRALLTKVTGLAGVIAAIVREVESPGNQMARAVEATTHQIATARANGTANGST